MQQNIKKTFSIFEMIVFELTAAHSHYYEENSSH